MSPDGNIYFTAKNETYRDDFSVAASDKDKAAQDTFIHEMTHVWQVQHGIDVAGPWLGQVIGHSPSYAYTLGPGTKFTDYGIEQQATIVQDYFALWKFGWPPPAAHLEGGPVPALEDYRRMLPFN